MSVEAICNRGALIQGNFIVIAVMTFPLNLLVFLAVASIPPSMQHTGDSER